jgi:hypothetical protein
LCLLTPLFFVISGSQLLWGVTPFERLPRRQSIVQEAAEYLRKIQPGVDVVLVTPEKYSGCLAYHWFGAYDLEGQEPACAIGDRWPQHDGILIVGAGSGQSNLDVALSCRAGRVFLVEFSGAMDTLSSSFQQDPLVTVGVVEKRDHWALLNIEQAVGSE